jgi:hypothetical protein
MIGTGKDTGVAKPSEGTGVEADGWTDAAEYRRQRPELFPESLAPKAKPTRPTKEQIANQEKVRRLETEQQEKASRLTGREYPSDVPYQHPIRLRKRMKLTHAPGRRCDVCGVRDTLDKVECGVCGKVCHRQIRPMTQGDTEPPERCCVIDLARLSEYFWLCPGCDEAYDVSSSEESHARSRSRSPSRGERPVL